MSSPPSILEKFWSVIIEAGTLSSADELISLVQRNSDILDAAALAVIDELVKGNLSLEEAFTMLDSSKSLVAKNLIHRKDANLSGLDSIGVVLSRPNPGTVAGYLKRKRTDTAIVSFHVVGRTGRDRVAIFVARNGHGKRLNAIRGFGDIYYNGMFLDGIKPEFLENIEDYARSIVGRKANFQLVRGFFDFLANAIFSLLWTPAPPREVIFIPHKLFNLLPLHALSVELDGRRLYLHDAVESISYASSIQELAYAGIRLGTGAEKQTVKEPHFLIVRDEQADLPSLRFEEKSLDIYRAQLEPQGVTFDVVTKPENLPDDLSRYSWISWSSHAETSPVNWGGSYLILGSSRINALSIMNDWHLGSRPIVMLAACETGVDVSGRFLLDEYCGLDLAFRIAGASAAISSLWRVEDFVAAFAAMIIPAWWLQGGMRPDTSLTALQRYLRSGAWKDFLLTDEQMSVLPDALQEKIRETQGPMWDLPDDAFSSEDFWAVLRCHGR